MFLKLARDFKRDPLSAADLMVRTYSASGLRGSYAERMKIDRAKPENDRLGWHIDKTQELHERGDTLNRGQLKEMKSHFPGMKVDDILKTLADFDRDAHIDPWKAASRLAFAFGAPSTPTQYEQEFLPAEQARAEVRQSHATIGQFERQLGRNLSREEREATAGILNHPSFVTSGDGATDLRNAYQHVVNAHQAEQQQIAQAQHEAAARLIQLPSFPKSGDQRNDYQRALASVQEHARQEASELNAAHREIAEFAARTPGFEEARPAMQTLLQHCFAHDLESAYRKVVGNRRAGASRGDSDALARAWKARGTKSSTGSGVGRSGGSSLIQGLDARLSDAIDRFM